jgi:hypothetical protein
MARHPDLPTFERQLGTMHEGTAYRALAKEAFVEELRYIATQDNEIKACEQSLSASIGTSGASTEAELQLSKLFSQKFGLLRNRRQVRQQDHILRQDIEDADQTMHDKSTHGLRLLLRQREDENGRRNLTLADELSEGLRQGQSIKGMKQEKSAEGERLQAEQDDLESKIEAVEKQIGEL